MSDGNQQRQFPPLQISDLIVLTLSVAFTLASIAPGYQDALRRQELNHYRLEAGRFGENRGYGLKSFAHDLGTWKLSPPSPGSVPSCWRMYSMIASSVTLPLVATK